MKFQEVIILVEETYYDIVYELTQYCYNEIINNKQKKVDLLPKIQTYFKNRDKDMYKKSKTLRSFVVRRKKSDSFSEETMGRAKSIISGKYLDIVIHVYYKTILEKYKSKYFKVLFEDLQHEIKHGIDFIRDIKNNDFIFDNFSKQNNLIKKDPDDYNKRVLKYFMSDKEINAYTSTLKTILKRNKNAGLHVKNFKELIKFLYYPAIKLFKKGEQNLIVNDILKNQGIYKYLEKIVISKLRRETLDGESLLSYFPNFK
jgi:hypothetical protein